MFIECNNIQALMDTMGEWIPGKEYLPPDPEYRDTTEGIYLCICDMIVQKAFRKKEDAEGYKAYHDKFGFSKCQIQQISLE